MTWGLGHMGARWNDDVGGGGVPPARHLHHRDHQPATSASPIRPAARWPPRIGTTARCPGPWRQILAVPAPRRRTVDSASNEHDRSGTRDTRRHATRLSGRARLPRTSRCVQRTGPHRRPAQPADPDRPGRHPQGRQVHTGECVGGENIAPPTPPRPPASSPGSGTAPPRRSPPTTSAVAAQRPDRPRTGLTFEFGGLDPNDIVDLDVEWPAAELIDATIIDTPGTSSLSRDVSARTLRLLVPDDGVPRVDAVVFLLRTSTPPTSRCSR